MSKIKYRMEHDLSRRTVNLLTTENGKENLKTVKIGVDYIMISDEGDDGNERVTQTQLSREKARQLYKQLFGTISRNKREGFYAGHDLGSASRVHAKTVIIDNQLTAFPGSELARNTKIMRGQCVLTKRFGLSEKPDFHGTQKPSQASEGQG